MNTSTLLRPLKRIGWKLSSPLLLPFLRYLLKGSTGRDLIYRALPKGELVIANTDEDLHYIVNSSDDTIGRSVFRNRKSFDCQHLSKSMEILGSRKNILLDAGANIGTIGIFGISTGMVSKCIAFEPEPDNFKLLKANVEINGLSKKFELHNIALSNEVGEPLLFELSPTNFGDHRVRTSVMAGRLGEESRETISVETNSLDNVCKSLDLDDCLLFMDTQGFEGHVLSGAKTLIEAGVPIVTEFWPYGLLRANGLDMFYSVLASAKYTALYDLGQSGVRVDFSIDAIKKITTQLGDDKKFTDLLFLCE